LSEYVGVARLEIVNILDDPSRANGIGWDQFSFVVGDTVPEPGTLGPLGLAGWGSAGAAAAIDNSGSLPAPSVFFTTLGQRTGQRHSNWLTRNDCSLLARELQDFDGVIPGVRWTPVLKFKLESCICPRSQVNG
jgi:hypothetical protein